jgi:hypothetical protein
LLEMPIGVCANVTILLRCGSLPDTDVNSPCSISALTTSIPSTMSASSFLLTVMTKTAKFVNGRKEETMTIMKTLGSITIVSNVKKVCNITKTSVLMNHLS